MDAPDTLLILIVNFSNGCPCVAHKSELFEPAHEISMKVQLNFANTWYINLYHCILQTLRIINLASEEQFSGLFLRRVRKNPPRLLWDIYKLHAKYGIET